MFGKANFEAEKLEENLIALIRAIVERRPEGVRGRYIQRVYISSTMGPGIRVDEGEPWPSPRGGGEAMPRPEKVAAVEELRERLARASAVVVLDYRGLPGEMTDLRRFARRQESSSRW